MIRDSLPHPALRSRRPVRHATTTWAAVSVAAIMVVAGACDINRVSEPALDSAEMVVRADVSGTTIATLVATVSAPDIAISLVFNFTLTDGVASATLKIPPGSNRTITVEAFAADGSVTHVGSVLINVQPGINPPVVIVLTPVAGEVPITVTLASFEVLVSPSTLELLTGEAAQLSAAILLANGQPVTGNVLWATTNPAIATVDDDGFVTAVGSGVANIVATYEGVAGSTLAQIAPTDLSGTYTGSAAVDVTGTALAAYAGLLVPSIFGCSSPCPATVVLTQTGTPGVFTADFTAGTVNEITEAVVLGSDLTLEGMTFEATVTIFSTNTLTCVSPAALLDLDRFAGPRITGAVAFDCSMTDAIAGSMTGIVTLTLDLTRAFGS
jgi:hypothetical protein